ncbi:PQQ-binding-like beta-propeller repeat protein [Flavivirga rizhaonensis]|uniref:Uncharacterized protein n=1 Tax=Flavivirga rizhaonensis TaxID=2559571 RepID=A0A4V3P4I5_9FLAO|nr:PQQ-binding-like beta-propeller repeat protein [Flavivirga rizhaonensis]TGV01564.1 hypothetical protein EM932_14885 [Flavivirga rizhaonensis]
MFKTSFFISTLCFLCLSVVSAQDIVNPTAPVGEQKTNSFYYGFEAAGDLAKWRTTQSENWITTTERKSRGSKSLKFTLNEISNAIESFVTPYTISKVRNAVRGGQSMIIVSSYDGRMLGIDFGGNILWDVELKSSTSDEPSGVGNNDIFCYDLNNDGNDEILVASADGKLYCLDSQNGTKLWDTFSISQISGVTPMYAVCVVKKEGAPYIACGNFDNSIYYLNADGSFNKEVKSENYSNFKIFGDKTFNLFKDNLHIANFLRPIPQDANNDHLGMIATNNSMQVKGTFYQFEPLEDLPIQIPGAATNVGIVLNTLKPIGYFKLVNNPSDNKPIILLGNSTQRNRSGAFTLNPDIDNYTSTSSVGGQPIQGVLVDLIGNGYTDVNGYRVPQSEVVNTSSGSIFLTLFGSDIIIQDENLTSSRRIQSSFAYNDLWKDTVSGKLLFAGSQSGGSCVHVIDTMNPDWEQNYVNLVPPGKITTLLDNVETIKTQVASYVRPSYEVPSSPNNVYFVTGLSNNTSNSTKAFINTMEAIDPINGPKVLENVFSQRYRNWDRASDISSVKYQNKRDSRFTYLDCDEDPDISVCSNDYKNVTQIRIDALNRNPHGVSFWGGHGNDPSPFSQPVLNEIFTADISKQKVLIYPEIVDKDPEFEQFMDDYFYEITDNVKTNNLNVKMHVRTKHTFWQGDVHTAAWDRLISGEFADIFIPSMEETQDKSMELSVAGRMGVWMSGAVNNWGSRSVPDNASYDRLRQFCHPRAKNHYLRHTIYSLASGATHFNNFETFESSWMKLVLELTAKGAIYVPKRNQLLSISPVHLSILNPDLQYLYKSTSVKFLTGFDKTAGEEKFVFGRLSGAFPGAKNTEYDFSTYAAGAKERRLNFIPAYENGMVLITPPDVPSGQTQPVRGKLEDHMHPFYSGKTKEYFTDGKKYYSDYNQTASFDPDSNYYQTIKTDIENSADLLPIKVSGNVAWVVCQTNKRHLRLTLIDSGYLNPHGGTAKVQINTSEISVSGIKNVLNPSETYSGNTIDIEVPLGGFKFFDITLSSDYY